MGRKSLKAESLNRLPSSKVNGTDEEEYMTADNEINVDELKINEDSTMPILDNDEELSKKDNAASVTAELQHTFEPAESAADENNDVSIMSNLSTVELDIYRSILAERLTTIHQLSMAFPLRASEFDKEYQAVSNARKELNGELIKRIYNLFGIHFGDA